MAYIHKDPYKLSGQTVRLKNGQEYKIEDYADRVLGMSWMQANGNPCAIKYAVRAACQYLPIDNDVLYGKIDGLGEMIHVTEIELGEDRHG